MIKKASPKLRIWDQLIASNTRAQVPTPPVGLL